MCRNIGFQRKTDVAAVRQRHGWSGFSARPAFPMAASKQAPCPLQLGIGGTFAIQFDEFSAQLVVAQLGPAGQQLEHAVRHFSRRRLGEGEAQDLGRFGACQQQPG